MGKLPYGPPSKHILESYGGDTDPLKFYCTQYGNTYGHHFSKFQSRTGRHPGTGYQSNFRPGVYYSGRLDQLDNPTMGAIVADNYSTITQKSFRPYTSPSGKEPLPNSTYQAGTGFVRQKNVNIPTVAQVHNVAIDTRSSSAPADVAPRYKPHLHKILGKDPVELENEGYGPRYMSTETQEKFKGDQRERSGPNVCYNNEGSGFTHAYNVEPVTFHPDYAHKNDIPGWLTERPTGYSIHTTDYRPLKVPQGTEALPNLANRSVHDTGFTSGTKARPEFVHRVMGDAYDKAGDVPGAKLDRTRKQDPTEYLNMTNPDNYSSVNTKQYQGKQRPDPSEAARLGRAGVGTKELSGYSENHDRFIQTSDNPARFVTHYQTRFVDKTPVGADRAGHTWGGIQKQKPDGFTKSTAVHDYGPDINSTAMRRGMEPYVGRSSIARDPFFDDHKHDSKVHRSHTMVC